MKAYLGTSCAEVTQITQCRNRVFCMQIIPPQRRDVIFTNCHGFFGVSLQRPYFNYGHIRA